MAKTGTAPAPVPAPVVDNDVDDDVKRTRNYVTGPLITYRIHKDASGDYDPVTILEKLAAANEHIATVVRGGRKGVSNRVAVTIDTSGSFAVRTRSGASSGERAALAEVKAHAAANGMSVSEWLTAARERMNGAK